MICVNTNNVEFQTIVKLSGLSTDYVSAICGLFLEKYGRFPYLDEIPGANSQPYIEQLLDVKNNSVKIDKILEITNSENLEQAQIKLNKIFSDLEIHLYPINNYAKIEFIKRPISQPIGENSIEYNNLISNYALFGNIINKLQSLYGIKINSIDFDMINSSELNKIPGISTAKAFVYNGEIYINTELADKDAPIHEMLHILIGGVKTNNPELYYSITQELSLLDLFNEYSKLHSNRTLSDIAEEMLVEEFSKLISNTNSSIQNENIKYELMYHTKRVLDSILMGESSIKDYENALIFNSSLIQLSNLVNSKLTSKKTLIDISRNHRILTNKKRELLENNELLEYCNG